AHRIWRRAHRIWRRAHRIWRRAHPIRAPRVFSRARVSERALSLTPLDDGALHHGEPVVSRVVAKRAAELLQRLAIRRARRWRLFSPDADDVAREARRCREESEDGLGHVPTSRNESCSVASVSRLRAIS